MPQESAKSNSGFTTDFWIWMNNQNYIGIQKSDCMRSEERHALRGRPFTGREAKLMYSRKVVKT